MGRASEILIPARFLLATAYFVVVVMAFYNKDSNVGAGVGSTADAASIQAANSSVLAALGLSTICLAVCLWGVLSGWTMFYDRLNMAHCIAHFFGTVLTGWYLVDMWGYASMWAIWAPFALLPAVAEVFAWLQLFVWKVHRY